MTCAGRPPRAAARRSRALADVAIPGPARRRPSARATGRRTPAWRSRWAARRSSRETWIERVAQAVAEQVEAEDGERQANAWEEDEGGGALEVVVLAAGQLAPLRRGNLSGEPQEGHRGDLENGRPAPHGSLDD